MKITGLRHNSGPGLSETYNGWANISTWRAVCWLLDDNCESEALDEIVDTDCHDWKKESMLRQYFVDHVIGEYSPIGISGAWDLVVDLVKIALDEIDYLEILESRKV